MSLKKRMFRSNMMILLCALLSLFLVAALVLLAFKGRFARDFESMEYAGLDTHVLAAARIMEQALVPELPEPPEQPQASEQLETSEQPQTSEVQGWEVLDQQLAAWNYHLYVVQNGSMMYGDRDDEGCELLQNFAPENHQSGQTEVFYTQGMTAVGNYDSQSNSYRMAVCGQETEWWLTPFTRSFSTFFYGLMILGVTVIAVLLLLSGYFTRQMLLRITEPLEVLEQGAKRIREDNLSEPVVYEGDVEFEQLCTTFNEMQTAMLSARQQRIRDEQARTDMITGISHDLRTPLTAIQGYIKGVLDGVADTKERQHSYLETAYEATREMNALLQKLFDFSRMESGQMPLHMICGDLAELTASYVARKEEEPECQGVHLSLEKEAEVLPDICMDIEQIRRILDNLLENSLKYAEVSPIQIKVRLYQKDSEVVLEWRDNGKGVPEEKLPHIFERFYRCDESRTKKGSGVGLYVVWCIAKQHGGRITAENRDGLMLRLYFPIAGGYDGTNLNCRR